MANSESRLPPGQRERPDFPRFGLGSFASRFPPEPERMRLSIGGKVGQPMEIGALDAALPRSEQLSDFHCVTGWSSRSLRWGGVRFADFHREIVLPQCTPAADCQWVVLKGADGYRSILLLDDLLAGDVLLADTLDGRPLGVDHGAPLRIVAPAHYGYKNVKHLSAIEYWPDRSRYRFPRPYPQFMDHPRARVAHQERGQFFPPGLLLGFYRLLVPSSVNRSARALRKYMQKRNKQG